MLECVRRASTVVRASTKTRQNLKGRSGDFLLVLLFVLLCVRSSTSSGISLGAHLVCARVHGLTEKQRAMCRTSPAAIAAVGDGLKMAYSECRVQLGGYRWNCSGVGDGNHFGHVMPLATREAAFTYAITSAGVTHALSSACTRGDLPACGCTTNRRRSSSPDQFHWGGCGEAAYGARFARRFLDARELEADARSLMNLHNNRVGRKMVKDLVRRECKCHGVSGSCALKTCWRALPPFHAVAKALRDKYSKAKMVAPHPPPATHAPNTHLVIRRARQNAAIGRQPRKSELVYLAASPSYCEPDTVSGSLGTHGRHCNRTSRGEDGCETLCCGRGYNTVRNVEETKCRCKFHWCCRVTCDTCIQVQEVHVCK
ncbi:protein Wnt-7b-like isoform X2 [Hyposmocoma kahamanoa]|uniref:protein Wnt-7b-like isoform X2 n=1 Tax=Hyposmocoma kahamanoa TaxID=1477025 RepID=UPI000E6D98CA|nr:protein Wnt-7b-like isoform X2 [Hyposmocoma kahamanoa]